MVFITIFTPETTVENMYANMKAIADDKRIMRKELAEAAGIDPRTLRDYFNYEYAMPVPVALCIANRLGYKLSTLLTFQSK